jgi:hypothetical protein
MRELRIELTMLHEYFNDLIEKKIKTCQCSPFGAKMWNRDVQGKEFPCPAGPAPSLTSFPARPRPVKVRVLSQPVHPWILRRGPARPRVTREMFSLSENFIFL